MDAALLAPLLPAVALAVNVGTQLVVVRTAPARGIAPSIVAGFIAGFACVAVGAALPATGAGTAGGERAATAIADLIAYLCLSYCYFNFLNLGVTARRIRLLIELQEAPGGLTWREILERYDAHAMVEARLGRMLAGGQIRESGGRYTIGAPLLLTVAQVIVMLKLLFLGARSEFERPGE